MVQCLEHRGPDGSGIDREPQALLGHRRLSIIDLVGGAQPMSDPARRYCIIFNGEIFNYRELRDELKARGCAFHTDSDTEVLLQAYAVFGEQTPSRLNGQFAFAIWDRAEQTLFAARDRMGEKPLYWAESDDGDILLASEIKSILAAKKIRPRIDPLAVDSFLRLQYIPPDRTIYANVHTLLPAHAMVWKAGQIRQWRYWEPKYSTNPSISFEEAAAQSRQLIERAVKRQMVADVPVGAFLSGGLDSTSIVALMSRLTGNPVKTFSVGFGDLINELPFARAVADAYHTEHHEIQMDISVGDLLKQMVGVYDEPFADSSNIPTYLVCQFASRHVKVCLSGDGGDELFGGYQWYEPLLDDRPDGSAARVALLFAQTYALAALSRIGMPLAVQRNASGSRLVSARLKRDWPTMWERHLHHVSQSSAMRRQLWGADSNAETSDALRSAFGIRSGQFALDEAVDFDLRCYLPGDILVKVDRAAMANSLETRAPFLDADLVEFVLSLPPDLRFHNRGLKNLMRKGCEDLWPAVVRQRSKQGFGAPVNHWLQRPDVKPLLAHVARADSPLHHLLPGAGQVIHSANPTLTWSLLTLGLWLEEHSECLSR